ncbi:hypothetical protein AAC387_Pa01g2728 [Persea americana]
MVWFQCENCGENLKKPKLQNHFRICSANKLSCIDCGQMFSQQNVQSHTQCITEAEKYGPKGQGKASNGTPANPKKESKPRLDIDINVGLSSHAPWFCSLCNTYTTSKQTLLSHADGKKHRAKARAFHAKQQPCQTQELTSNEVVCKNHSVGESMEANCSIKINGSVERISQKAATALPSEGENESASMKKRKLGASRSLGAQNNEGSHVGDLSNGEVIQSEREAEAECFPKKSKKTDVALPSEDRINEIGHGQGAFTDQKIKWKKMITSILKSNPDGVLKMRKLRKLASKTLEESGITVDEVQLRDKLEHKINSSSRFILDNKLVRLVLKSTS